MTFKEVVLAGEAWQIKHNLEWERTRWLGNQVWNAGIVARGGKVTKADLREPHQWFPLPIDKEVNRERQAIEKEKLVNKEAVKAFYERAVKAGVKLKPQNFDNFRVRTIHDFPRDAVNLSHFLDSNKNKP